MTNLKGSDKQIKWAEAIRENIASVFAKMIAECEAKIADENLRADRVNFLQVRLDALNNAEYAGDVINLFKDVRFAGNIEHDFGMIMAVYNVSRPATKGEAAILLK